MEQAAIDGNLDELKKYGQYIYLDNKTITQIVLNGHIHILQYLRNEFFILPHDLEGCITDSITSDVENIEMLEWLKQEGVECNSDHADTAALKGKLLTLQWMKKYNVYATVKGLYYALKYSHTEVHDWIVNCNNNRIIW